MEEAPEEPSDTNVRQEENDESDEDQKKYIFTKAVMIAKAAKEAEEHAAEAASKVVYIRGLANRAEAEAEALDEVANSLALTATSIATVALQVCRYATLEEAFFSNEENSKKMDFDTFKKYGQRQKQVILKPTARNGAHQESKVTKQKAVGLEVNSDTNALNRHPLDIEYLPDFPAFQHPQQHIRRGSLPVTMTPLYPPEYLLANNSSTSSVVKFNEKFPSNLSVGEYKDTLVSSFDSKSNITPLWEDRYVSGPQGVSDPKNTSDKWIDKKAMKQFQLRLHKADTENSSDSKMGYSKKDGGRRKPKSLSELELETSSDSEMEEILSASEPKPVSRVKALELLASGQNLKPRPRDPFRAVSPLLTGNEKEYYSVSGDESNPAPSQKHMFLRSGSEKSLSEKD